MLVRLNKSQPVFFIRFIFTFTIKLDNILYNEKKEYQNIIG